MGEESTIKSSHDFFGFLGSIPAASLLQLYGDPNRGKYVCRAVLQHLPELAGQYVYRLVACGGKLPRTHVDKWHSPEGTNDAILAMKMMESLCVIESIGEKNKERDDQNVDLSSVNVGRDQTLDPNWASERMESLSMTQGREEGDCKVAKGTVDEAKDDQVIRMTPQFFCGMKASLSGLQSAPWIAVTKQEHEHLESSEGYPPAPTVEELKSYSQRNWDSVLHLLLGLQPTQEMGDPAPALIPFLKKAGLMKFDPDWNGPTDEKPLVLTRKGYDFIFEDFQVQGWHFIQQVLQSLVGTRGHDGSWGEALLYLICLGYCRVGEAYRASALSEDEQVMMQLLSWVGFVLVRSSADGESMFYPTASGVNVVVGCSADGESASQRTANLGMCASATQELAEALLSPAPSRSYIAIIVQTNFQVCAYTKSELYMSMLELLCDGESSERLPNVVFYKITRKSVKSALKRGIQVEHILRFLKIHAHPVLRKGDQPLLPATVEDQIFLWGREHSRIQIDEVWFCQCQSSTEFDAVYQHAEECEGCAWSNKSENKIAVKYEKAGIVKTFLMRWRFEKEQRLVSTKDCHQSSY